MGATRPTLQHALTDAQAQLLDRHKTGLLRAASSLAGKNGLHPHDVMFVLADRSGRIGRALSAAVPIASIGPVVLPGRADALEDWVQRLAMHGPVWDLTHGSLGIPVVLIDQHDAMAVCMVSAAVDDVSRTAR